jgi:hypothetical protein
MRKQIERTYRVTFERIGRHHDVAPLTATVTCRPDDQADKLAEAVWRYARKYLASRDVETQVDLPTAEKPTGAVMIFCGFRTGGTGTVEVVDNVGGGDC